MSTRTIGAILLALTCGGSVAIAVSRLTASSGKSMGPSLNLQPVVLAAADIPRGKVITEGDVTMGEYPGDYAPAGAIMELDDVVGRVANCQLLAGDVVIERKIAPKDRGLGLQALIPKGMRAYTIQTSRLAANVAGFILPENKVDVLLTLRGTRNDDTGGGSTTTLLQMVEVLAVDQRLEAPAENKVDPRQSSSVTLLVTPEQAALLDLGQSMGQLSLALRNLEDTEATVVKPATLADIRYRAEVGPDPDAAEEEERYGGTLVAELTPNGEEDQPSIMTLRGRLRGHIYLVEK